jgi:predicted nucleotidyltransferase
MAISNDQLQVWANPPSSAKSQHTYQQIQNALNQSAALKGKNIEIYLQGSYANSTNTRLDSDVDVVIQLNSTFSHDISKLEPVQQLVFHQTYANATYDWSDFRLDVIRALTAYFGQTKIKTTGNKSVKLIGDEYLLNGDIVPSLQHRVYNSFDPTHKFNYVEGMKFWTIKENKEIINFPKVHKYNGEQKNATHRTDEMYKDIVRILKTIRRKIIEQHNFDPGLAPSYFVECAVYNVPDGHFIGKHQDSLEYAFEYLNRQCDASKLLTVSHQHLLFGTEPWQWNTEAASQFLVASEYFYKNN